ncbi:MAG: respiratory chain complex I subunit 1 family protein [Symbiobacteriia bacterium]
MFQLELTLLGRAGLQALVILALAPGLNGLIKKFKARLQNRQGPPVLQPYRDLRKYFVKEPVVSRHSSWLFRAVPYVALAAYTVAAVQVPLFGSGRLMGGDLLPFIYLFALARVSLTLAALDTGSNFGGMGAARELAVSALVEPVLFLSLAGLAAQAGTTQFGLLAVLPGGGPEALIGRVLGMTAFTFVAIAEMGRIPVDNPDTHLELTMIHEGMLLEYSGRHLAVLTWAAQIKQFAVLAVLANVFIGIWPGGPATLAFSLLKVLALGLLAGLVEFLVAKVRFFRLSRLLGASFVVASLSVVTALFVGR